MAKKTLKWTNNGDGSWTADNGAVVKTVSYPRPKSGELYYKVPGGIKYIGVFPGTGFAKTSAQGIANKGYKSGADLPLRTSIVIVQPTDFNGFKVAGSLPALPEKPKAPTKKKAPAKKAPAKKKK